MTDWAGSWWIGALRQGGERPGLLEEWGKDSQRGWRQGAGLWAGGKGSEARCIAWPVGCGEESEFILRAMRPTGGLKWERGSLLSL